MSERVKPKVGVAITDRGPEITVNGELGAIVVTLTPEEVSDTVHLLLKACMKDYVLKHSDSPGFGRPITSPSQITAPISWPLMSVLSASPSADHQPQVGLCAAFGEAQVVIGLQRAQIKDLANYLLRMDEALPPSNKHWTGLEDLDNS